MRTAPTQISPRKQWTILGVSTVGQAAAAAMIHGPAFLITALVLRNELSLAQAGFIVAAPTIGVMVALFGWGMLTDRYGERAVLISGLVLGAAAGGASVLLASNLVLFAITIGLAGAASASSNVATARVIVGWFPPERRGLAMGIRQTAQPLGVGIGALTMASTSLDHGVGWAMAIPAIGCALCAIAVAAVVIDPPRPERVVTKSDNPYLGDRFLHRIHAVSVLLVVPQFMVWTFSLVWLIEDRGWEVGTAGAVVAAAQMTGVLSRIAAGQISDMAGSRVRPLRWIAWTATVVLGLFAATAGLDWSIAVVLMVFATAITVADNGLAFTAVAEKAGPFWGGRALAVQNTGQFAASSLIPPIGGAAIAAFGIPAAFAVVTLFPIVALALIPRHD